MFIADIFEAEARKLIVVYPGRFQPFHKGHHAVFSYLSKKYGRDQVYIATSNKTDGARSPFSFSDKAQMMALTGVPMDRVIETREPYRVPELTSQLDPHSTVILFAVSQKDMDEDPRFSFAPKKDGHPSYFQPAPADLKRAQTLDQHAYIITVPTFDFQVLGQHMKSGTEVRNLFSQVKNDPEQRKAFIKDLFGAYSPEVDQVMQGKLMEGIGKSLATAALAGSMALGAHAQDIDNAPVQQDRPVARALATGMVGLRAFNKLKGTTVQDIHAEAEQEIRNIIRGNNQSIFNRSRDRRNSDDIESDLSTQREDSNMPVANDTISPLTKHRIKEEGGVGVIASKKQANDPRYMMSLTKDVRPGETKRQMRKMSLESNKRSV